MKTLNEYINEGFYNNVVPEATIIATLEEINKIEMVKGYSKFKYSNPEFKKMLELWNKFPVGTKLKWPMDAGWYRYEKIKQGDVGYAYWRTTRAPWNYKRNDLEENIVKDFYASGNISRGPLELDE